MEANSPWTISSLKEHYDVILKNMDVAIIKAESATEKRFEGVNEFRAQLADQTRTFMPRVETEVLLKNINEKIDSLIEKVNKYENRRTGGSSMMAYIIAGVSFLITVLTIILSLLN